MKVCLLVDDYLPSSTKVGAKMMHELAVELMSRGHAVSVIAPQPNLRSKLHISSMDGVTVCRFASGELKNISKLRRAINESLLPYHAWRSLRKYLHQNPHDLVVYYSPTIFWGVFVSWLKYLWGARSYLILRDFFPQWVIDRGILKSWSPITKYFRLIETINYRAADTIGLQSPANIEVFRRMSRIKRPLEVLYNWSLPVNTTDNPGTVYRERLGLGDKVVFFYGGNIGAAQDMMNIARLAFSLRNDDRVHFLLVGSGDEFELLQTAISEGKAGNMTLLPAVSQSEYFDILSEIDVGLFSLHRSHTAHNFPGKILGYMAYAKPILGSINPQNDLKGLVEGGEAGFVCPNGDDEALLDRALYFLDNPSMRTSMGENAKRILSDTFSVSRAANQIIMAASIEDANLTM